MVKWEAVIEDKNSGGIGIRDLRRMNEALGGNLVWRMITGGKD